MQPYEYLGLPSPDECVGVIGLTASLLLLTIGVATHLFVADTIWSLGVIITGLFVGWVSFMYCIVWGRGVPSELE